MRRWPAPQCRKLPSVREHVLRRILCLTVVIILNHKLVCDLARPVRVVAIVWAGAGAIPRSLPWSAGSLLGA